MTRHQGEYGWTEVLSEWSLDIDPLTLLLTLEPQAKGQDMDQKLTFVSCCNGNQAWM